MQVVNEIVLKKIDEIIPYEKNPRRNSKTVELLVKVLPKVGFNVPLVLDEHNVIVKGHARYEAAKKLGMTELPCVISHASPDEIKADRIADNRVQEFSQWVQEELGHEIDMLDIDIDLGEMGLNTVSYENDFDFMDVPEDDAEPISQEEMQRRYEEFLRQQEQNQPEVSFVTQSQIDNANSKQRETASAPPIYYQVTCEKCGHIIFVREGDDMEWE